MFSSVFVCLLLVSKITQKVLNGFSQNLAARLYVGQRRINVAIQIQEFF